VERARRSATYFEEIGLTGLPSVSIENKVTEPAWDGVLRRGRRSLFPVPPSPLGSSGIITLARNSRQNTDVKELRGQNLENKRVRGAARWVHPTVTASTMIARFCSGHKVRCHIPLVEIPQSRRSVGERAVCPRFHTRLRTEGYRDMQSVLALGETDSGAERLAGS
jgi:hypothetical protein